MTMLIRTLRIGECMALDGGRVVITCEASSGRRLAVRLVMHKDVIVDKPRVAANDDQGRAVPARE